MAEISESQRLDIKWAIDDLASRVEAYKTFSNYYRGNHRYTLAGAEHQSAFRDTFGGFAENLCATVVDTVKDRLKLTDFTHDQKEESLTDGEQVTVDPLTEKLQIIYRNNRMDERQGEVHGESLKCGDAYVIVWPDEENNPQIDPNEASLCTVRYSESKRSLIDKAAKVWLDNEKYAHLNLYYSDRIEKFKTAQKIQGDFTLQVESYTHLETLPNPYEQVPVFHFRNNAAAGKFGTSELLAAIPSQDRLNKTIIDGLIKSEEWALPVRWALGFETPIDPRTKEPILNWKPGDWWISRQKDGSLGQLPGADLKQFVEAANDARIAIARVTRTPLHYFQSRMGVPPSGESLKTQEAPLTAKIRDRQITFGNTWEDVFVFALKIVGVRDVRLEAVWENTEPRDDSQDIANLVSMVKELGFSQDQALRERGYSDAEIQKMKDEKKDEPKSVVPPIVNTQQGASDGAIN